ncbi:hairy-related 3 [Channa argus]|uniref:hairy-related 3 n=1 Tax=Channa argus TaxID=215402 RepID=UPI00351FD8AA
MVATTDCAEKSKPLAGNKVSKPLMEKKRRARINKCLDQLKCLLESYYSSNIRKRKLEKADILELTVKHLRSLQKLNSLTAAASEFSDYQMGFRGCLANVSQYLLMADNLNCSDHWVLAHLSNKLSRSLGRGGVSSTMDSGPGHAKTQDEAARFLPLAAGSEEKNNARSKILKPHSASTLRSLPSADTQESSATKKAVTAASTKTAQEKCCKTFPSASQRNEVANTQHNVWRPW